MKLLVLFLLAFASCLIVIVTGPRHKHGAGAKRPVAKRPVGKRIIGKAAKAGKAAKGACVDTNKYCSSWAKTGECTRNPAYMKDSCPFSCELCGAYTCIFTTGDGTGGTEFQIGQQTGKACVDACVKRKKTDPTITGVTVWSDQRYGGCWCEQNMKSVNSALKQYKTCFIKFTGKPIKAAAKPTQASAKPIAAAECKDMKKDCGPWATQGFCNNRWKDYMDINCKSSCGKCGKPVTAAGKPVTAAGKPTPAAKFECGKQNIAEVTNLFGRIVGGTDAVNGEWPWQVGLLRSVRGEKPKSSVLPFCGGTLVNPSTVLTAAHCFPDTRKPADFFVRVGDLDMKKDGAQEDMVAVKQIFIHEKFNPENYVNDIAIMILNKNLKLEKEVNAACLPENNKVMSPCVVTGWGKLDEEGLQSTVLQKATVPIVKNAVCNTAYQKVFTGKSKIIGNNMICAGYKYGAIDACQGDSGGPLVCKRNDGKYVLKGIVSWGVGCAKAERYGVYTNTFKYMDWIRTKVNL